MLESRKPAVNPYILAAENPTSLISLLTTMPQLASSQDEHGYSLVHAAASYGHTTLLRTLVSEYKVPVDIRDEDRDTPLFCAETLETAKFLVEELDADVLAANSEGITAAEHIEKDGEFPLVAAYLKDAATKRRSSAAGRGSAETPILEPPVPENVKITVGTMEEPGEAEQTAESLDFRRRIEELASREDFHGEAGQAALRELVSGAVREHVVSETERAIKRRG
ncbi:MAG: hypothetical protein M1829_003908 [Trizodia sp. TS-e1964]|nr:MAG: hypothetical protein M1829_003908 [Trizodia sp. TS-e1964]